MVRTVIFDLDGTLLDTLEDIADAMNETLAEMGFPTHPVEAFAFFVGDGVEAQASRVLPLPERDDPEILHECISRMLKRYRGRHVKTKPYPGIVSLLERLKAAGIQLAVLSNKPHPFTILAVEHYFAADLFAEIVGAKKEEPKKPHPKALLDMIARLGVDREAVVYIGDTNTDMKCAANARIRSVGVTWGFRDRAELAKNGADAIVDSAAELAELLGVGE
jgi:phosphoglycolate phosphatase